MKSSDSAADVPTETRLESAFRVLANETRVRILFALYDAPERVVSFSALNDRVGLSDSGRFNYHLKQLTGRFIYRTEEGYALLFSGLAVCRSMLAALDEGRRTIEPFSLDSECYNCGTTLVARYDHEYVVIRCPNCGVEFHDFPFPPGTLAGRNPEELLSIYDGWMRAQTALALSGLCTWCFGRRHSEIVAGEEPSDPNVRVVHTCERCGADMYTTVGETFQNYPAVISFLDDHGIDVSRTPSWDLEFLWSDEYVTVLTEDPWRVRLRIPLDDETLTLTLDGDVTVLDVTRE
ncbi:MAG TPA: winged helix-turn-helix domain-containing protein [Halococcus sp.]|nr:winged helix-turn-helix domain-containing protein [Halococcus sp.]